MKAMIGFLFFVLFLAGLALVNLRARQDQADAAVTSSSGLVDKAWRPVRLGEMRLPEETDMFIQFEADGRILGHGGCNRFTGRYEIGAGTLTFGPQGATRMTCAEPAMSFELSFLQALEATNSASSTEQFLTLKSATGNTLLRLTAMERHAAE